MSGEWQPEERENYPGGYDWSKRCQRNILLWAPQDTIMVMLLTIIVTVAIIGGGCSYGQDCHYGHSQTKNILSWAPQDSIMVMIVTIIVTVAIIGGGYSHGQGYRYGHSQA